MIESPEMIEALSPALERGHHIALIASEGAGLSTLYALAAAHDLIDAGPEARAFVLTSTTDRAQRCARAMAGTAVEAGLDVLALSASAGEVGSEGGARIVVGTPGAILERVRTGRLPASEVRTVVLDDVSALRAAWPAVEAVLQASDAARRIAATAVRDAEFDDLLERRLTRARRWPGELFEPVSAAAADPSGAPLSVVSIATRTGRLARLVAELHALASDASIESVTVLAADDDAAAEVEIALAVEGFHLADREAEAGVRLGVVGDGASAHAGALILFELPGGAEPLAGAAGQATRRTAIVDPLHARQLDLLARRVGWTTRPAGDPLDPTMLDEVEAFRARVATAVAGGDLGPATLLLAPVIEEHGAGRVAAALADLLRAADRAAASGADATAPTDASAERATRPTWTKVFVNVGRKDGAGPGDLVGAITGETGVAGAQVGKIDIRQTYTLIEVDSLVAEAVVRGLAGIRIKGRDITARLDRGRP